MPPADKKAKLPNIKLSRNIRKAIEQNVGCEEDLIKTLQDVEIKKRAARNKIILKKDALLRHQRRRWESMPEVLGRFSNTNQSSLINRKARDNLECSTGEHLFATHNRAKPHPSVGKLPSLPASNMSKVQTGLENDKKAPTLAQSKGHSGIKKDMVQSSSDESLHSISERYAAIDRDGVLKRNSGVESSLRVHSWPTSPSVQQEKSILKRRRSVAEIGQTKNAETTAKPAWLRRQTLHDSFCSSDTPRTSDNKTIATTSDPSLLQTNAAFALGDLTLSRYRKVLNRRRSLQAPIFDQPSCSIGRLDEEVNIISKTLQDCHVRVPQLTRKFKNSFRRVSFQRFGTEPNHNT